MGQYCKLLLQLLSQKTCRTPKSYFCGIALRPAYLQEYTNVSLRFLSPVAKSVVGRKFSRQFQLQLVSGQTDNVKECITANRMTAEEHAL